MCSEFTLVDLAELTLQEPPHKLARGITTVEVFEIVADVYAVDSFENLVIF